MFRVSFFSVAFSAALCIPFPAACGETPVQSPGWDASEFQLSEKGPCSFELTVASLAVRMRDSGQGKEKFTRKLPSREHSASESSISTEYSVADDVYGNPAVAAFPYFAYRNITCMRRHMGKPTPSGLSSVSVQVLACQDKFGVEASDHLISCIQTAVLGKVP